MMSRNVMMAMVLALLLALAGTAAPAAVVWDDGAGGTVVASACTMDGQGRHVQWSLVTPVTTRFGFWDNSAPARQLVRPVAALGVGSLTKARLQTYVRVCVAYNESLAVRFDMADDDIVSTFTSVCACVRAIGAARHAVRLTRASCAHSATIRSGKAMPLSFS
jgi:hypothetical protein